MAEKKYDLSILLIDDDSFVLNLALRILTKLGYSNVETANNGSVALGKLITAEVPYELIITDLNMPEMDGVQFLRQANNSGFKGGIILFSGEDSQILEAAHGLAKAYPMNILGALQKPLRPNELEDILKKFDPTNKEIRHTVAQKPITGKELNEGMRGSANNQLHLVYQPKVSLITGEIAGVETLARWWNSERGVLGPGTFIPLAQAMGEIDNLSNQIYTGALSQAAEWVEQGINLRIAINVSINSFSNPDFCDLLLDATKRHGLAPEQIVIEVKDTQTEYIPAKCLEALMSFRLKRFGLSIDDFGTGKTSLTRLINVPFTEMKIDKIFVNGASQNASALAILESSIDIAKKLNMEIVAEGVEVKEDWELVKELGCDYVQGFYCAKPMRNEDLLDFIKSWEKPH